MTTRILQSALPILTLLATACGSAGDGGVGDGDSAPGGAGTLAGDGDAFDDTSDKEVDYTWPEPDDDRFSEQCTVVEGDLNLVSTIVDPGLGDDENVTAMAADAGTLYYVVHDDQGINGDSSVNNARVMAYDRSTGGDPAVISEFHSFEPPTDMIIDETHLYFEEGYDLSTITSDIVRVDRATGELVLIDAVGVAGIGSRAQTEDSIYFSSGDGHCFPEGNPSAGIYRLDKETEQVVELGTGFECPTNLVLDGDTLFFQDRKDGDTSAIVSFDLPTGQVTTLATSSASPRDLALLDEGLLVASWGQSGILAKDGGGIDWFYMDRSCDAGEFEVDPDSKILSTPWGTGLADHGLFTDILLLPAEDGSVEFISLPSVPYNFDQHATDGQVLYIYSNYDREITILTQE